MIPNAMPPFDFGLGETADALREQVQRFSADQVAPIAAELDKTDRFPRELWPKMGGSACTAYRRGGVWQFGLGYLEHVIAVEEVEPCLGRRAASPTARTRTFASTRSAATAPTSRRSVPPSSPASMSAAWR